MEFVAIMVSLFILAASLVCLACWIWVVVSMFKSSVVTGICGLLCGIYALYWGWAVWDSPHKTMVMSAWSLLIALSFAAQVVAGAMGAQ